MGGDKPAGLDNLLWKAEEYKNGYIIENKTEVIMYNSGNNMLGYKRNNSKNLYVWAIESVVQGKWVTFRNIHRKNYCLDDNEKKISVSTNTVLYTLACDYKNENQWFSIEAYKKVDMPKGWFNVVGKTGLCVASRLNNGNLQQEKCKGNKIFGNKRNNNRAQIWAIELMGNGKHVHFRNYLRNKCLDDTRKAVINNFYYLKKCSDDDKNQWFLLETPKTPKTNVKIPENKSFNLMGSTGLCTDAPSKIGERVTQDKCTSKKTLRWKFVPTKGGYVIKNNNDFVLENKESKKDDKNPIIANKGKKGPNQIWVIELTKANKFIIRNPESNKCFTAEGKVFYIFTCDKSSKKQNFELGTPEKNTPANKTVKPAVYPISVPVKETPKTPKTNVKIPENKSFNIIGSTGLCTDAPSKIGERVTQDKCTSKKTLRWKFVPTKGGYVIKNNNDFVLENKESKKDDKNPIIANKGKKGPNQIWVIELTKANKFIIRNPESNKCFTAEGKLFYILTCDKSSKKQNF